MSYSVGNKIIHISLHVSAAAEALLGHIVRITVKTKFHNVCKAGRGSEYIGNNNGTELHYVESSS